MSDPKLSRLELRILDSLWYHGQASIREMQETFPDPRPAYTTIQTIVYRMEAKGALRRGRRIGNADLFEPLVPREATRHRVFDEILSFFGGKAQPMMTQLVESGRLTPDDIRELEETIRKYKSKRTPSTEPEGERN